jgi:hypothetical protein
MSVEAVGGLFAKDRASFCAVLNGMEDCGIGPTGGVDVKVEGLKLKIDRGEDFVTEFGAGQMIALASSPFCSFAMLTDVVDA